MKYQSKTLKNGLTVITVPMADNPTVTVLALSNAGSKYETEEKSGISHFVEHMCFKGTARRPKSIDISYELDALGADYNAFTSQEFTGYFVKGQSRHLSKILDVVSDIYINPTFPEDELEREKGVIIEEINMYEDVPQRHIHDVFGKLLYGNQPAGWDVAGTKETVRAMTRDDLKAYHRRFYVAPATTVVVAGSFDSRKIYAEIEKAFSGLPTGRKPSKSKVKEVQKKPEVKVEYKKTDQTHMILGVRAFDVHSKWNPAARVLTSLLGGGMSSRLFQKLREEMGVAYYVKSVSEAHTDVGTLEVATGADHKRTLETIEVILGEMDKFKRGEFSERELKKAKDCLVGGMMLGLETTDAWAEHLAIQEVVRGKIEMPKEEARQIRAVTAEDVKKVAKMLFRNDRLNLAAIGKFRDGEKFKQVLKW